MLNKIDLLDEYIHNFLGYGNLNGDLWFIGVEEAGSIVDLSKRLQLWEGRGKKTVESSPDFKKLIGDKKNYFGENNKIQSTLNKLIRLELAYRGEDINTDKIRLFQRDKWGTFEGSSAALELSSLPRDNIKNLGNFDKNHELSFLRSNKLYNSFLKEKRTDILAKAISKRKPKHIIMYGESSFYRSCWEAIKNKVDSKDITFQIIKHPQARSTNNDMFEKLGEKMKNTQLQIPIKVT